MAKMAKTLDPDIDSLINLDALESLIEAYGVVRNIIVQEGVRYDPLGRLWQEKVLKPLEICERVSLALLSANCAPWKKHHDAYMIQIARIRKNAQAKMKTSQQKLSEALADAISSEDLLAAKMRELMARLSAL